MNFIAAIAIVFLAMGIHLIRDAATRVSKKQQCKCSKALKMNTIIKKNNADTIKRKNLNNQQMVQALLDWDEERYCYFKYETGISYAKHITDNDIVGFNMIIKTRFFWQWWKNEWADRDAKFLQHYMGIANQPALTDQYLFHHNISRLRSDRLMERMACSMIGYCMDEFHKNKKEELAG